MKRHFRRMLALVSVVAILLSSTAIATAAQTSSVEPRLIGISGLGATLSISSSGLATCGARVYDDGTYDVTLTITLQQDGTTIKTWSATPNVGFNSIPKSYYVASGYDYQVAVTAIVKSGSVTVATYTEYSTVVSY